MQTLVSEPAALKQQTHKLQMEASPTLSAMPKAGNR